MSIPFRSIAPVFACISVLVVGFLLAGCDSNGSDSPEPTAFEVTVENVGTATPLLKSGVFNTRTESGTQGPIRPGEAYGVTFTTGTEELPGVGTAFSFATMFIHSNDMFYAFEPGGLKLFENGQPISGSVTDQVYMWDAGTEEDQEPGTGSNQPMQGGAESGPDDDNALVRVEDTDGDGMLDDSGFTYPAVSDVVNVVVSSTQDSESGGYEFTVRIENVSDGTTINGKSIPLSPGSWAVHFDQAPNGDEVTYPDFAPEEDATGTGLEDIAEDGDPSVHAETLRGVTGVTVPLSPGAVAVHSEEVNLFETGAPASAGIERIAEDGLPGELVSMLTGTDGIRSIVAFPAENPAPLPPNQSFTFSLDAQPGDRLSLATMYVQSNDLFYAFEPNGIALFDGEQPIAGDVTDQVRLYDAGTEGDQEPGVGLDQAPRQSDSNTGPEGEGTVSQIEEENEGYSYPPAEDIIRVTITPPQSQ